MDALKKCCFLDRDGVVNVELDYLCEPDKTILEKNIVPALHEIHKHGFLAVVVTNQSGIARGKYDESAMHAVHRKIQELLKAQGEWIDAFYFCPHHPKITGECDCRKPLPGMLLRAAEELKIDLAQSLMIGDRLSDVRAGRAAGCAKSYLVRTGYGESALTEAEPEFAAALEVADDALSAFRDFLKHSEKGALPAPVAAVEGAVHYFFFPKLDRRFFLRLGSIALSAFVIFKYLLLPCVISGASMEPTVHSNGFTFCWSGKYWFREPRRGDIVIIKYDDGIFFLKRVAALPGETVEFRKGKLYVDGKVQDEPYVKFPCDWEMEPVKVEPGQYYVVGDNRSMPFHQHQKGAVRGKRIIGAPLF